MDLRDIALLLNVQPATALLSESPSVDLFYMKSQLKRWIDLTERELQIRYPVLEHADRTPSQEANP